MSTLDDIKARAETNSILGKTASQDEAKDTLKLVAALEAADAKLQWLNDMFQRRAASQAGENRYTGYALGAMEALVEFRVAVSEALS